MPSDVYYISVGKADSCSDVSEKTNTLIEKSDVLKHIDQNDFTAIKMHFGEEGNIGHIRHEWVASITRQVAGRTKNAFLTDSNVLYKSGMRTNSVDHIKIADLHGYNLKNISSPVIIADGLRGKDFAEIPVFKKHFINVKIASQIASCDSLLVLTHVTGHMLTGLGGAIKNLGMGCASRRGKYEQHCGVVPEVNVKFCIGCGECAMHCPANCIILKGLKANISPAACIGCGECAITCRTKAIDIKWSETLENLQEKMVEYAYGAVMAAGGKTGFVSYLMNITKDCDCMAKDDPGIVEDLGILASLDPVSIDKASVDMIIEKRGSDILKEGYPETDWMAQLKYAVQIGLGNLEYNLIRV